MYFFEHCPTQIELSKSTLFGKINKYGVEKMQIIIIAVIAFFVILFIVKKVNKKKENEDTGYTTPAAGSRAEKAAIKDFRHYLSQATGNYGHYSSFDATKKVAECYALGKGTEKGIEKAKYWAERSVREKLQQKAYFGEFGGGGFTGDCLDFFLDGKLVPVDLAKAEELALLLALNGTQDAKKILQRIYKQKHPDQEINVDRIIADYPVFCLGRTARSKRVYGDYCAEMKAAGVSDQKAMIAWMLNKAGWNVTVNDVAFPGVTAETEAQFKSARAIEAKGQDFKQAAAAYEAPAMAGHTEAMRRLGLIMRDILNIDHTSKGYIAGVDWLKKAAEAGNALAAFDLKDKNADVTFIAGLAGMGNYDAVYALGNMVENGIGGQANWDAGQAILRHLEAMIGDPVATKNGEGIYWLIKLGKSFRSIDDEYFTRLADEGHKIGYALCTAELCFMSDVMMKRAFAQHGNKVGEYGDFGYCGYIIELAKAPCNAGIEKIAALSRALREERYGFKRWSDKELTEAEQGTGYTWQYVGSKFTPQERVARTVKSIHREAAIVYTTRCQKGLNYYEISDKLLKSDDFDSTYDKAMQRFDQVARARRNTIDSYVPQSSSDNDIAKTQGFQFPERLVDNQVDTWELQYSEGEKAEYRCRKTGARTTIWATGGYLNLPHGWRAN